MADGSVGLETGAEAVDDVGDERKSPSSNKRFSKRKVAFASYKQNQDIADILTIDK